MKHFQTICLLFLGMMLPALGNILEFREFTLKQTEGQKPLTSEQIKNAILHQDLGKEKAIRVEINDGKFSHSDVTPVRYASEYNADFSVAEFVQKDVGIVITGTAQNVNQQIKVAFTYHRTTKVEDLIYGTKNNRALLVPAFNSFHSASEVTLDAQHSQWAIVRIPSKKDVRSYMAVRFIQAAQ